MIRKGKDISIYKIISAVTAGIFLWNQIVWAGDLVSYSVEKTLISGDVAWVIAMLEYSPGVYHKYSFQFKKIDDIWKLIYYHVDQSL